MFQRFLSVERK